MVAMVESMAYNKAETPWHGLGVAVDSDLTPEQMLKQAGLDWEVEMIPAFVKINKKEVDIGKSALIRSKDQRILSVVSNDWRPLQNLQAFEFFNEFIAAGDMDMETAGSLCKGELVWGLARIKDGFSLFKGKDEINSYLLLTNPHRYGWSISVANINVRVVCMNTLRMAMNEMNNNNVVKVNHRKEFIADQVKVALGIAHEKLEAYKAAAQFLSSKKMGKENVVDYFKRVFPVLTSKEDSKKEISKPAQKTLEILDTQPGAELGEGTWWQGYNAVTYYLDHKAGRSEDTRLTSSWYGSNAKKKIDALKTAVEFAEAA